MKEPVRRISEKDEAIVEKYFSRAVGRPVSLAEVRQVLEKQDLEKELCEVESKLNALTAQRAELVEKLEAVDLLRPKTEAERPLKALTNVGAPSPTATEFTPVGHYWRPILEALEELGGSARSDVVIERVGSKMEALLRPGDKELLSSGVDVRWRNRAAWQRFNMVRLGLLRADSPRGVWEITDKGRSWLREKKLAQAS